MTMIRHPAVAGLFYPDDAEALRRSVTGLLAEAPAGSAPAPKAIIAPHAGYIYSGPIAASAYANLRAARDRIHRVVLLGPSHRVALRGLALPDAEAFETPLGRIALDQDLVMRVRGLVQVKVLPQAHLQEHSLEVHLPFLQTLLTQFTLLPLVVGDAAAEEVGEVLEAVWGGDETLIIISSDLSHYHDYRTAQLMDQETARAIEGLQPARISYEDACGRNPINGLLTVARRRGLHVETVDLRNSGDTAGPQDQVVGYGAFHFREALSAA